MFEYFTETEIKELKELKDRLFINPGDYFFGRLNDYAEFKEISSTMLSLQWHYFNSGLVLVMETFKSLAKAVYSLVTLNFSVAGEQACTVTKAALAAIAKLILNLGLFCVHTIRLLTLLVATFPQASIFCTAVAAFSVSCLAVPVLGIWGLLAGGGVYLACFGIIGANIASLDKPKQSKKWDDLDKDIEAYEFMIEEVGEERTQIITAIDSIVSSLQTQKSLESSNPNKIFFGTIKPSVEYLRKKAECEEFVSQFYTLINSYPCFDAAQAKKEPDYVRNIHKEMEEHHVMVKLIAEECFKRVDAVDYQRAKSAASQTI